MGTACVIDVDLADVWEAPTRKSKFMRTLAWGDEVSVVATTSKHVEIETVQHITQADGSLEQRRIRGFIVPSASSKIPPSAVVRPAKNNQVLRVNFIDVQQGDAAVIESPDGKVVVIDGGESALFARYLAGRFRGTTLAKPKRIDCIVVTHGDADHFAGLPAILESETNARPHKRLFIRPIRVFHNGIVKRPSKMSAKSVPDSALLGPVVKQDSNTYLTGLVDDVLSVPVEEMNEPFRRWKQSLQTWATRSPITFRRLQFGDHEAFDWFTSGSLRMEVLGPLTHTIDNKPSLRFLGTPSTGPRIGHEVLDTTSTGARGLSASHTINGHSIVLRLVYGGFSYLFTGDLNDEASRHLARLHNSGSINLLSDVFKVPHHGSADFSGAFIQAVSPIVSVVSSGDESTAKEYIHPRATLVGALGRYSRFNEPLVFITELVAFFQQEGWSVPSDDSTRRQPRGEFYGFSRAAWGAVKTRTDGTRLVVFTDSGNVKLKEAYAYQLDGAGVPQPAPVTRV